MPSLTLSDFDYDLPESLIAQHPSAERSHSRLLHLDSLSQLHDHQFKDIVHLLRPNDLLVFNNTKVIKARLYGEKSTGGKVEVLVERILSEREVLAHVRSSKSPKPGSTLTLAQSFKVEVKGREGELFCLSFPDSVLALLDQFGALPLPPYITHSAEDDDESRYQTVYAKHPGAIAAPTAGLHFDEPLLQALQQQGINTCFVTLHVGAGTFQPVRHENLDEHIMHKEFYDVGLETIQAITTARQQGGRVIAVGTTSVRALESAATKYLPLQPTQGDTQLFITPGFEFKVIDALITNFHLPKSTLLMLISALAGIPAINNAYTHAIAQHYRFFSYGDAMFIEKPSQQ